jgi:AT-rich interactive domain-containing protein 1
MPPRPSSSHSQQGIPPVIGQQQLGNQGPNQGIMVEGQQSGGPPPMQGYPGQPSPHMQQHGAYKLGPYPPQSQYSQGNYSPRGQYPGYGNQQGPPGPPNSPGQYRPMHNHVGPPTQGYPPHGYPQVWPPPPQNPTGMSNHIQGKNIGPPPPQSPQAQQQQQQQQQQQPQQAGGSPRQLNYLKQHLQHKGGYSGTTPPPQGYGNGPGIHPPMGPPSHHMGPPIGPGTAMGPPPASTGTPPGHMENPGMQMPPSIHHPEAIASQDNGMIASSHQVTSIVTTGPDGTLLDEASQQSTLSNTSIGIQPNEFHDDFFY